MLISFPLAVSAAGRVAGMTTKTKMPVLKRAVFFVFEHLIYYKISIFSILVFKSGISFSITFHAKSRSIPK